MERQAAAISANALNRGKYFRIALSTAITYNLLKNALRNTSLEYSQSFRTVRLFASFLYFILAFGKLKL